MLFHMVAGTPQKTKVKQKKIDEKLFILIGEGDISALEELYISTERTMYAYVLSVLKNPHDTLDIVQETYLKIRASAHLYKPMGKPLAWMFTIARNLSMNFVKGENRKSGLNYDDYENNPDFAYISDPTDSVVLKSALKILSEDDRKIVLLYAVSGLKHREIAESLELPLSTVLSKYNRSLKKLKEHLTEKEAI